jgi:hypothetical protein
LGYIEYDICFYHLLDFSSRKFIQFSTPLVIRIKANFYTIYARVWIIGSIPANLLRPATASRALWVFITFCLSAKPAIHKLALHRAKAKVNFLRVCLIQNCDTHRAREIKYRAMFRNQVLSPP